MFDNTLPAEGDVKLTIETTHKTTTLYVNGEKREALAEQRFHFVDKEKIRYNHMPFVKTLHEVWLPTTSIRYLRALFFPLQKAGSFNSKVKELEIEKTK